MLKGSEVSRLFFLKQHPDFLLIGSHRQNNVPTSLQMALLVWWPQVGSASRLLGTSYPPKCQNQVR